MGTPWIRARNRGGTRLPPGKDAVRRIGSGREKEAFMKTSKKWIPAVTFHVALMVLGAAVAQPAVVFHEAFEGTSSAGGSVFRGEFVTGVLGTGWASRAREGQRGREFIEYAPPPGLLGEQGTIEFHVKRASGDVNPDYHDVVIEFLDGNYKSILTIGMLWEQEFIPGGESAIEIVGHYLIEDLASEPWGGEFFPLGRNVPEGSWVHVAVTWGLKPSDCLIYIDGKPLQRGETLFGKRFVKKTGVSVGAILSNTVYIRIGSETAPGTPDVVWSPLDRSIVDELRLHDVSSNPYLKLREASILSLSDDTFKVPGISGKLVSGDEVTVTLLADPGGTATFDLGDVKGIAMEEVPATEGGPGIPAVDNGTYQGKYTIQPGDDYEDGYIVGHFVSADNVVANPVSSDSKWTIDTKPQVTFDIDKKDLPADSSTKARIKLVAEDANGDPLKGRHFKLTLATTEEYTGTVGAGDFGENVGATVETRWRGETDAWGEVEFDYIAGFAAKTVILSAKDLDSGGVTVDYITSYKEAAIDIALTPPVNRAAARRGVQYIIKVKASRTELTADGRSRSVIRAKVMDPNRNPVAGDPVTFTLSSENGTLRTIKGTTDSSGVATAEYRAGKKIGIVVVTATATLRNAQGNVSIILLSDAPAKIYLKARPETLPADGFSRSDLEVKVTDINDNPNQDTKVEFRVETTGSGMQRTGTRAGRLRGLQPLWRPFGRRFQRRRNWRRRRTSCLPRIRRRATRSGWRSG
jgi:hypothetical protein